MNTTLNREIVRYDIERKTEDRKRRKRGEDEEHELVSAR